MNKSIITLLEAQHNLATNKIYKKDWQKILDFCKNGDKVVPKVSTIIKKKALQIIHADYKPIKNGIVIKPQKRNRAEILNNQAKYVLGDNFKSKILPLFTDSQTAGEVIREDELLQGKTDADICKEMEITEISADEIAERVIQRTKNIKVWTIIGYCNGFVVYASVRADGRLDVSEYALGAWRVGRHLFSRDKNSGALKV